MGSILLRLSARKMKLIKNYLCSTMSKDRLNSLAMISIDWQLTQKLDFKDITHDFAMRKVRRLAFGVGL